MTAQGENLFLDLFTLRFRPCTKDVLVAVLGEFLNVGLAQQPCIGHHYGLVESEARGELPDQRYHGMPLGDVALVNLIADGIATAGNEQTEEYLRAGVPAVLRKPHLRRSSSSAASKYSVVMS